MPSIVFLLYCVMTSHSGAFYERVDTVSKHYSVAREVRLYTGLDLSLYVEDLRCHIVEGDDTRAMVRFDIQREHYADLVKINQAKLGELEGVSSEVFKNRLVEHRKTLPDKAWFWGLLEHGGPFFAGKASGGRVSCDVFAVSGTEEILRVIIACQNTHRVELAEEVLVYTGLDLPTGAENIRFEVVQHEALHYHGKTAFVRFELEDDHAEEIAGFLSRSRPYGIDVIYRDITPRGHMPEWWKVEASERFSVSSGKDKRYGQIALARDRISWLFPMPSGGNLFHMKVDIRLSTDKSSIEQMMDIRFSGNIYNVKRCGFSSGTGDYTHNFRFDASQQNLIEAIGKSPRISFKYADLKTDRKTLEVFGSVGYPVEKSKIEFWEEQLGLTRFVCASEREPGLPEGQFRNHYICVTPLSNDNVRVYFMDNGGRY